MKLELSTLWMSIILVPTHSSCLKFGPEPKHPTLQRLVRQGLCPFATTHFCWALKLCESASNHEINSWQHFLSEIPL